MIISFAQFSKLPHAQGFLGFGKKIAAFTKKRRAVYTELS